MKNNTFPSVLYNTFSSHQKLTLKVYFNVAQIRANYVKRVLFLPEDATCFSSRRNVFQTLRRVRKLSQLRCACNAHLETAGPTESPQRVWETGARLGPETVFLSDLMANISEKLPRDVYFLSDHGTPTFMWGHTDMGVWKERA